jgi:hypothetical protein
MIALKIVHVAGTVRIFLHIYQTTSGNLKRRKKNMIASIKSFSANQSDGIAMAEQLAAKIRAEVTDLDLRGIIVFTSAGVDIPRFREAFISDFSNIPILGTTSHLGVGSENGFLQSPSATAMVFYGSGYQIGTGFRSGTPSELQKWGADLARDAVGNGNVSAQDIRFAILFSSPGGENQILKGIYEVIPEDTPVLGGGIASTAFAPDWYIWNEVGIGQHGAVLAVCNWPWELHAHFENGYMMTGKEGVATDVVNSRILKTIDHRPAAIVYNEWMNGALAQKLSGGNILKETTLKPLGISRDIGNGIRTFLLIHPEEVLPDQSIKLFADVEEGEELFLMFSQTESLVKRPQRLSRIALSRSSLDAEMLVGSIMIYCAGCLTAIREKSDEMLSNYRSGNPAPFIAGFTFGEVGCVQPGVYGHGNLMLGALFLSNKQRTENNVSISCYPVFAGSELK